MQLNLRANQFDLTDAIRDYAEKKIGELDRFVPEGTHVTADMILQRTTGHHKKGDVYQAETNISVPGQLLTATAEHEDLYAAIDKVRDDAMRELKRYKEKLTDKRVKGGRIAKEQLHSSEVLLEE